MKFHVKLKLSLLWISIMMCYIYADIIGFMQPGHIERIIAGDMGGFPTTPGALLGYAVTMAIPSIMIFLTIILKSTVSYWLNLIIAVLSILGALVATTYSFSIGYFYYVLFGSIEIVLLVLVVWHTWTWPKEENITDAS